MFLNVEMHERQLKECLLQQEIGTKITKCQSAGTISKGTGVFLSQVLFREDLCIWTNNKGGDNPYTSYVCPGEADVPRCTMARLNRVAAC